MLRSKLFFNKKTDTQELRFYDGRKRATKDQIRDFFRTRSEDYHSKEYINPDFLSPKDKRTFNAIKAGKKRAESAVRIDGKFVNKNFFTKNKVIDFEGIAKKQGFNNVNELFLNDTNLLEKAKELYRSSEGAPRSVNSESVLDFVDTFKGKIYINNKRYDKLDALGLIDQMDKFYLNYFDAYMCLYEFRYKAGFSQLHISLPDEATVSDIPRNHPELMKQFGITVIRSDNSLINEIEKTLKSFEDKENKEVYTYKYKYITKAKGKQVKKTKTVKARNITEAEFMAQNLLSKNDVFIDIKRVKKAKK